MDGAAGFRHINMNEPLVEETPDLRKRIKQYKIITSVFFLLSVASIAILIFSILYGFGCQNNGTAVDKAIRLSTMKFIHVSDMHLDLFFNQSTSTTTFCRSIPNNLNITPTNAAFSAPYGRVGCDSPIALIQSTLESMKTLPHDANQVKFFLLTGDQVAHRMDKGFVSGSVTDRVLKTLNSSANAIKKAFSNIPILPSMGNNDLPGDYVLPKDNSFFKSVLEIWQPMIICSKCVTKVTTEEELKQTFLLGGYYKAEIKDEKLVMLQLNTNYWTGECINRNPGLRTLVIADAQMAWLIQQLKDAQGSGKVAIITGHIPPGIDGYGSHGSFWPKNYTEKYIELVTKTYRDVVIGQLFGHMHKDDMRFQKLKETTPKAEISFLLTGPGVTPLYRNNPGYRVVSFDKDKRMLTDYVQYYMDVILSTQNKVPIWLYDYSFGDKYLEHVPLDKRVITGKVLSDIVESFINKTNANRHWQTYIQHRQVNYQPDPYSRYVLYCVVKYVMKDAFDECVKRYPVTGG